jgi:hypothetical protein
MQVTGVQPFDIVQADKKGRKFFGVVVKNPGGGQPLTITPMDRAITWRSVQPREVVGVWRASKATRDAALALLNAKVAR